VYLHESRFLQERLCREIPEEVPLEDNAAIIDDFLLASLDYCR